MGPAFVATLEELEKTSSSRALLIFSDMNMIADTLFIMSDILLKQIQLIKLPIKLKYGEIGKI